MEFSAFAEFGFLEFSAGTPISESIYFGMRRALGDEENLGEDTFAGPMAGKLFATALELGAVQRSIDHVNAEARPSMAEELLGVHELDFKIQVPTGSTSDERRAALAQAERVAQGNTAQIIDDALVALLGSLLVKVRRLDTGEFTVTPSDWDSTGPGLWKPAATIGKTHQLTASVWPGTATLTLTSLHGDEFIAGDEVLIEPTLLGLEERVTLTASGADLQATLTRPHPAGSLVTSCPWPRASSTRRHMLIVVTSEAVAKSRAWQRAVAKTIDKMLCATDRWSMVVESAPGALGPFMPGTSIPGSTPLVAITTEP